MRIIDICKSNFIDLTVIVNIYSDNVGYYKFN